MGAFVLIALSALSMLYSGWVMDRVQVAWLRGGIVPALLEAALQLALLAVVCILLIYILPLPEEDGEDRFFP